MNMLRNAFISLALLSLPIVSIAQAPRPADRGAPTTAPASQPGAYEARVFKDAGDKTLLYRLLKPAKYDPDIKYPLVLFLHGAGERGADNRAQLIHGAPVLSRPEMMARYPSFVVAPQCPAGGKWSDVNWGAAKHETSAEPSEPMRLALALLAELPKEFSIDTDRLYVTGLSMGGYGAWDVIVRHPDLFAAAVPVCGGGDEAKAAAIAKLPIWCFHGDKDTTVPTARSRNMIEALRKAGGEPKYSELPGVGHNAWGPAYSNPELWKWLFAQKRAALPKTSG